MSRSLWKGPYININDIKTIKKTKPQKVFKISRNSIITPKFLGMNLQIYNGKNFNEITVTDLMIGHKFGEFSFTRAKFSFKKKKSSLKKKKSKK